VKILYMHLNVATIVEYWRSISEDGSYRVQSLTLDCACIDYGLGPTRVSFSVSVRLARPINYVAINYMIREMT